MATSEQQAIINTIKPGDLVLITSTPDYWPEMLKVKSVDPSDGTIHVWGPPFSLLNDEPHTWGINGPELCYTGTATEPSQPSLDAMNGNSMPDIAPLNLNDDVPTVEPVASDRKTLQPLEPIEVIHVNPTGPEVMKLYWGDQCPYHNCNNHMFCPGCNEADEDFPDLAMVCGTILACPVCMGYQFARQDKEMLQRLEREVSVDFNSDSVVNLVKERCDMIDARREELGYEVIIWNLGLRN